MTLHEILHTLRNPYGKDSHEVESARLEACLRLEDYQQRLGTALRLLTEITDASKLSNEQLNKIGYQDFDEETRRVLKL